MNHYQQLGLLSIFLLILAIGLSIFVLTGRHSRKLVYGVAGIVLVIIATVMILCGWIYSSYS